MYEQRIISPRALVQKIRQLPVHRPLRILNVCGGHERTIAMAGLRHVLPKEIDLVPGPGCPVCVCPEEDLHAVIDWAMQDKGVVVTFGDMLRVPVNVSKKNVATLEHARQQGASIIPVASPLEVISIAKQWENRSILFFAVGFETTMAPVAALIKQGLPDNVRVHIAGRRTAPIVEQMFKASPRSFDAVIAPGHVASIMGANEWKFVADQYQTPVAVCGFRAEQLLVGIYDLLSDIARNTVHWRNCYREIVSDKGNETAQALLDELFETHSANWRGIGEVANSGFRLRGEWQRWDAQLVTQTHSRVRAGEMPRGCECAKVILGQIKPSECVVYGRSCTPQSPIGPCMVSDEGACRIWWQAGERANRNVTAQA